MELGDSTYLAKHEDIQVNFYDRTGHLPIWKIFEIYQRGILETEKYTKGKSNNCQGDAATYVIIRCILQLKTDTLREIVSEKKLHYTLTDKIMHAGNTTMTLRLTIFLDEFGKCLCELNAKSMLLDKKTKRPLRIPKSFKDEITISGQDKTDIKRAPLLTPPTDSFKTTIIIHHSSVDRSGHVNNCEYFRFLMDCATMASTSGYYRHFLQDMCWYPLVEVDVTFLEECFANDELDIFTWQDGIRFEQIYFLYTVRQKRIFQASCVFDALPYKEFQTMSKECRK